MKKAVWKFVLLGLGLSLLLAIFISPYASSSPDGLEKVAEDHGFLSKAEDREPTWTHSPVPDYAVPGVESESAATGLAGLVGTLIVFGFALVIGLVIHRRKADEAEAAD